MKTEKAPYQSDDKTFEGFIAFDESNEKPKPGVLVAHAWKGQDHFAREKAKKLAKLGYVGFAADVYGRGIQAESDEEALALMTPLFCDRDLLRKRIYDAYNVLCEHPEVDSTRLGAIGFCFGGLTVLELLRMGADLKTVVSFHALLGTKLGELSATSPASSIRKSSSVLILHGYDDPMVSAQDLQNTQKELTEAGIDWQMHIYGHTSHAFTNPEANDSENGLLYHEASDARSWLAMENFFKEKL